MLTSRACLHGVQLNSWWLGAGDGWTRCRWRALAAGQWGGWRAGLGAAGCRGRRRDDRLPTSMSVTGGVTHQVQREGDTSSSALHRQGQDVLHVIRSLLWLGSVMVRASDLWSIGGEFDTGRALTGLMSTFIRQPGRNKSCLLVLRPGKASRYELSLAIPPWVCAVSSSVWVSRVKALYVWHS